MKTNALKNTMLLVFFTILMVACQKENIVEELSIQQDVKEHGEPPIPFYDETGTSQIAYSKKFVNQFPLAISAATCYYRGQSLEVSNSESSDADFLNSKGYLVYWINMNTQKVSHIGTTFDCACGKYRVVVKNDSGMLATNTYKVEGCGLPR